ncbi:MAG: phosphoribosyl-ATP diphosphatase [Pseudomonadota bacterium]
MADEKLGSASALQATLAALAETIDARAGGDPSQSYTAKLLNKGPRKCAQKIVEEAGELAIALAAEGEDNVASEAADLLYHVLVGLRARGVALDAVAEKLDGRAGVSGLSEKASRSSK